MSSEKEKKRVYVRTLYALTGKQNTVARSHQTPHRAALHKTLLVFSEPSHPCLLYFYFILFKNM
jgi:hypothetical protein